MRRQAEGEGVKNLSHAALASISLEKTKYKHKRKPHFSNHRSFSYILIMPKVNCSVIGCSNSTYKINKWKKKLAQNTTLKLKLSARRKGTALNVNYRFIYMLFLAPLNVSN